MAVEQKTKAAHGVMRLAAAAAIVAAASSAAHAQLSFHDDDDKRFYPGNLVVSRSVYDNRASNVTVGQILPPNCAATTGGCSAATGAPNNGTYPFVWNNDSYDGSFGITSRIFLDQITPWGWEINSIEVPNSLQRGVTATSNQLVTSFSSKSEIALHLSTDRRYLTFMGYVAPVNVLDVSNSNTPGVVDPTNPAGENFFRAVARVGASGKFEFTETNAYSGNNGRSAILNNTYGSTPLVYTAGNAGNGGNPQPAGVVVGAGAQLIQALKVPEDAQNPGPATPVGSFSVTQLGVKADKIGKDDNFRGIAVYNDVLYYTKGSGGNGVNTVYFVDTTGTACPKGVGLPVSGAKLPTASIPYDPTTVATTGLTSNMCILAGFPSTPNKTATVTSFPFALWFANPTTLYVADEGDGYTGGTDLYAHAAAQTTAGLQKWIFNATTNTWQQAYTLTSGLALGTPYAVKSYPTGTNSATGLPWAPATDGLRNLTGHKLGDDYVAVWAITSTVSGNGDTGADPDKLVVVFDKVSNTDPTVAARESFYELKAAKFGEVLRGVEFTPGTDVSDRDR